jgi:hypothetical protein
MSKVIFRIMAGLVLFSAALLLLGGIVTMVRYPPRSPWDALPLTALVAALVVVAIGLFYLRKWAALTASVMTLYVATWEIRAALHPIPGYTSWLGFLFAILLIVPSVLTGVYWRTLLWHNKQI